MVNLLDGLAGALLLGGFGVQYWQTRKDKRDSFSTWVPLLVVGGLLFGQASLLLSSSWSWTALFGALLLGASQLALLELVTRLRREQRMLPESCFLRISFRPKYLRRYFWEWDDFRSYVVFLGAACLALGMVCAVGQFVPGFVQLLELLAVVCWSLSPAAQLLRSRREGSEGLARSLVGLWLVGAILSTVSRWRNDEGVVSLVGSVVHVALLIGMVYQLFANRRKFKAHDF